jgi:hypothetical protein
MYISEHAEFGMFYSDNSNSDCLMSIISIYLSIDKTHTERHAKEKIYQNKF